MMVLVVLVLVVVGGRVRVMVKIGVIGAVMMVVVVMVITVIFRVVLLGTVRGPTLDFWYHICMDIDTAKGEMSTAINGEVVSRGVEVGAGVREERAGQLQGRLVLGKWNYTFEGKEEQFRWTVTNLNIFRGRDSRDLAELTRNLCSSQGDYLAWSTLSWELTGPHTKLMEEAEEDVCGQDTTYRLALGHVTSQGEAVATCTW